MEGLRIFEGDKDVEVMIMMMEGQCCGRDKRTCYSAGVFGIWRSNMPNYLTNCTLMCSTIYTISSYQTEPGRLAAHTVSVGKCFKP